jgi:hypothetical protein
MVMRRVMGRLLAGVRVCAAAVIGQRLIAPAISTATTVRRGRKEEDMGNPKAIDLA